MHVSPVQRYSYKPLQVALSYLAKNYKLVSNAASKKEVEEWGVQDSLIT